MLERVLFLSQPRAEALRPPRRSAIISITDRDRPSANLRSGWDDVLRLPFDDFDPVTWPEEDEDFYEGMEEIDAYQMVELAEFCAANARRCRRIVVHCRYGQSRSAGVAKALAQVAGLWFPPGYADHNTFVYRVSLRAMQRAFARHAGR
ncbi:MAG: hypothetical protein JNM90_10840 [Burkholderiales bacterium]|nr:hypothetical protein [Burkholderiales bacterium]